MKVRDYFKSSIFRKLIGAFSLIAAALVIFLVFINVIFVGISAQYDSTINDYRNLGSFFTSISDANQNIKNYIIYNSSENFDNYNKEIESALQNLQEIKNNVDDQYVYGKIIDLQRMVLTYREGVQETLDLFVAGNIPEAYNSTVENDNVISLIIAQTKNYYSYLNMMTEQHYNDLIRTQESIRTVNIITVALASCLSVIFIVYILKNIREPINKLYKNAKQIAGGNFNVEPIHVKSTDEVSVLAEAFNNMVQNINYYIKEQKEKSKLEKKLIIEENRNLQTKILLRQTKLQALETKINPHFLFNTLNMIAQTAYLEGSKKTREMIEVTSDLLRFYLDKAGENVSLKEELENVSNYIYIQERRVGNRIKFDIEIDCSVTNIIVPGMILQPLVENSIIHGLPDCTNNGVIIIRIKETSDHVVIEVYDNGKGMKVTDISDIRKAGKESSKKSIGLDNIVERIELMYGKRGRLTIESKINIGTTVVITLPKEKEKNSVA